MKECYLYKKAGDYADCQACNHRCHISPFRRGICGVRENHDGKLYTLIYGRIIAENIDPIEKKPLYHFLPGTKSLSIASAGCNLKCPWCFPPKTKILTNHGLMDIENICKNPHNISVISHTGQKRKIKTVFQRSYNGKLIKIKAGFLPLTLNCTPNHQIYFAEKPFKDKVKKISAENLISNRHYLAIPKKHSFSQNIVLDNKAILEQVSNKFRISHKISFGDTKKILELSKNQTSKQIGRIFNLHPAYVRTLRSKLNKESLTKEDYYWANNVLIEKDSRIHFKTEKKPYLSRFFELDENLAFLLGYYCAEGNVTQCKNRPNSYSLHFSPGKHEIKNIQIIKEKFIKVFGLPLKTTQRRTTIELSNSKTSIAIIFKILCGHNAKFKKVPQELFRVHKTVLQAFLEGYIIGDGYHDKQGLTVSNTVSKELALGLYALWSKLGYLPRFYEWHPKPFKIIENRKVNQSILYYVKVWQGKRKIKSRYYEDDKFFYVPILNVKRKQYSGLVYNLEIEKDHSYLANFVSVGNCQNWDISQCTKGNIDRAEFTNTLGIEMEPEQIIEHAKKAKTPSISYTYTEPTIFLEFALDTMKLAKKAKIKNVWVSNGYMTKETLDLINPYLDAINVDLKGFSEENYLKYSGGKLQPVLDNIRDIYKRGIHLEVTTLIIPGINDDKKQLSDIAAFLVSISPKIPWHISRFFPAYKMTDTPITPIETLKLAEALGKKAGLKYIHLGNI
ncbi:MAG: radical SAM protein [Patescibacteria group bacterium]|jgi:pyruvate-formate lyase-activating enzyme